MRALCSTRSLLLVGQHSSLSGVFPMSKVGSLLTSFRSLSRVKYDHAPLTLSSLGFVGETKSTDTSKSIKPNPTRSSNVLPKNKVKVVPSEETKRSVKKNTQEQVLIPFAANSFSELGLPASLIERLENEGFTVPTEVQSAAIPPILNNHDVVIQSYTGSGKTLAYLLPILTNVGPFSKKSSYEDGDNGGAKKIGIQAVIIAPSRELAMQIVREFEKILGPTYKRAVQQLVGGANRTRQEEALRKNKPVIVVGTPGRIAEISAAGKLHTHGCRYLVLDEVDELLSFTFREDMHRILEHVGRKSGADPRGLATEIARRTERRLVMVSATVPFSVIRAARSWGCEPLLAQSKKVAPLESFSPQDPVNLSGSAPNLNATANTNSQPQAASQSLPPALKHYYCVAKIQHKVDTLRRCVHALDAKYVIAFMNHTKQLKDTVYKLSARGMEAAELHGDLGKLARSTTLRKFKKGELRILVTNELSARGLDVAECDLVVNLELPTDSIHYAHRAGRTGRLGRKGTVISICEEPEVFVMKKLQKQLGVPIAACEFVEGRLVPVEEDKAPQVLKKQGSRSI